MKATAAQIAKALAAPSSAIKLYLLHGPDTAAANDLAAMLGKAVGPDGERIDLDGATLRGDPARLVDEAGALSLFGTPRYLRVQAVGEESLAAIDALLAGAGEASPVVAIAPAVRAGAKVVKRVVDAPNAMAFACYPPDAAAAERLAAAIAGDHGLTLELGVAARLVAATGGDRALLAREIEKLALHADAASDRPARIDHEALDLLGASTDDGEPAPLVSALIEGDVAALARQLALVSERGGSAVTWLRHVQRRLFALAEMRAAIDAGDAAAAVMKRHRVFFREEAATLAALRRWPPAMLAQGLVLVRAAERAAMRMGPTGAIAAEQAAAAITHGIARRR